MADNKVNIFEKYGIKEVANVYFEALENDAKAGVYKGDIVLYLDSLKVSTIETTAENTAAQGGWGNPKLVQWDYGKEINITLEDALMSFESLRFMLGGSIRRSSSTDTVLVRHTEEFVAKQIGVTEETTPAPKYGIELPKNFKAKMAKNSLKVINLSQGWRTQIPYDDVTFDEFDRLYITGYNPKLLSNSGGTAVCADGDHIRLFWTTEETGNDAAIEVSISPDTFPGTYRVIGDTFIRSAETGDDEMFQFVIDKAKVTSNVTLTLQAEGDPTTFEMTLNVLRSTNAQGDTEMMRLVRYSVEGETKDVSNDFGSMVATESTVAYESSND